PEAEGRRQGQECRQALGDALDEDELALRSLHPQRLGAAILFGVVPASRLFHRRELEHDEALGLPAAFERVHGATAGQELAAVLLERRRHLLAVFLERGGISDLDLRDDVAGHDEASYFCMR